MARKASYLTPYTEPVPDTESETAKLLKDTAGDYVCDLERDKRLLSRTQKTVTTKEKIRTGASVKV